MDLKSEHPFWAVRNGLMYAYPPLEKDCNCEALVVGGGITGAILANELMGRGIDTVVVDRRDIGHGSTSASTALLQYEIDTPLHELIELRGREVAERAYRMGIEALDQIGGWAGGNFGFRRQKSLLVCQKKADAAGLVLEFKARKAAGLPVRWLDGERLKSEFGIESSCAILSARGASMDPYRFAHGLFQRNLARGLRVYDRTAIPQYLPSNRGLTAVTDRGGTIRCRRLFFATGFEAQEVLPRTYVKLRSTYAFVSEPCDASWWRKDCLVWETGDPYLYARRTTDGRMLVGGEDDGVMLAARRDAQTHKKAERLRKKFAALVPGAELEIGFAWSGVFGGTEDGLPFIGPHEAFPNAYFALGFGGNGITFSAMAAGILADCFEGKANSDAAMYSFSRVE
jgi:glycine/D-amino acid oxidase-like deaminating enzyme